MSRPPRPPYRVSPSGAWTETGILPRPAADLARLTYLPAGFAELFDLEEMIARTEVEMLLPGGQADAARSLFEAAALLGHILARYQNLYAGEAFLPTARFASSLVRHARRLAYLPDGGLAATGHLLMQVKDGLKGRIVAGFAVASSPLGEQSGQTYECLGDLDVDAAWNEMHPLAAEIATQFAFAGGTAVVPLVGTGLDLTVGSPVLLEGQNRLVALRIDAVAEIPSAGETHVTVRASPSAPVPPLAACNPEAGGYRLLVEPASDLRVFGWQADPVRFPTTALASPAPFVEPDPTAPVGTVRTGYVGVGNLGSRLHLAGTADSPLAGQPLMIVQNTALAAYQVMAEESGKVAFRRAEVIGFSVPTSITTVTSGSTTTTTINTTQQTRVLDTSVSASVTALVLRAPGAASDHTWTAFPIHARVLANWRRALAVVPARPNPAAVVQPLHLAAPLAGMRPGRTLILANRGATRHAVVELTRFEATSETTGKISWRPETLGWTLGDVRVLGNVARISHGESVENVLGGSDGVTPFQRFALNKAPVTQVPAASGGELELEIRVDGVLWHRVDDFAGSEADDRVYRIETDEEGAVTVIFGNGQHGAIPHAGRKAIVARYRVGLGTAGNAGDGRVVRVKKASPILDRVSNPLPIGGGAPAATADDIRTQATRFIRTFDRAVSVADYADLALLFPGVARAAARLVERGVELVAATAEGVAPEALDAVRAFLDARRDRTVPLRLAGPEPVDVTLALVIAGDPDVLPEIVKAAVQEALYGVEDGVPPGLFAFAARSFGEAAHLSQVYAHVSAVSGVESVDVVRFDLSPGTAVRDVIRATLRQWLRLKPESCEITMVAAGSGTATAGGGP